MQHPKPWQRLDNKTLQRARLLLAPWEKLVDPVFSGLENIPADRPLLFVGNHTIFGMLDFPLMFFKLLDTHDIHLRALGDRVLFKIPIWRDFLVDFGASAGSPENCDALMEAGECLLVFPGGAREVAKRRDEEYKLVWKERSGFARHALRNGCTIVPFAAVGAEDLFRIVADADDYMASPFGGLLKRLGFREEAMIPIVVPKSMSTNTVERFYFRFMEPVRCPPMDTVNSDNFDEHTWALRELTRVRIEEGIQQLLEERENDPLRTIPSRQEVGTVRHT